MLETEVKFNVHGSLLQQELVNRLKTWAKEYRLEVSDISFNQRHHGLYTMGWPGGGSGGWNIEYHESGEFMTSEVKKQVKQVVWYAVLHNSITVVRTKVEAEAMVAYAAALPHVQSLAAQGIATSLKMEVTVETLAKR